MKKIRISRIVVAIMMALTVGLTVGVAGTTYAEGENSTGSQMTVSPMNQKIILTPGESYQGAIKVSNPNSSTQNLKFSAFVGSFSQKADNDSLDDYGTVDTDTVSAYNQMMQWITIDKPSGEVAPNETVTIPFTVNVPADAPAGGQYATIIVKNDTNQDQSGGGNVMIQSDVQIASIIYALVTGQAREEGEILSNSIPNFLLSNQLKATAMVQNSGNVHTDAKYVLQVWPLFSDEEICTNEEDPATSLVLPETKQYHVESCTLGMVGVYRAKQTVTIFGETSIVEATVVVCPIWLIVVILLVIGIIVFYFVHRARSRRGRR